MSQPDDQRYAARRVYNQGRIIGALTLHSSLTRADLAEHIHLSRATVALLVNDLLADGRVQEQPSDKGIDGTSRATTSSSSGAHRLGRHRHRHHFRAQ